jgi:cyclic pyranopterin phosphate synthase
MPEHMQFLQKKALLSYEEILALMRPLAEAGINKIRITGGEPFLRKDLMQLLEQLTLTNGINDITITTNGVLTQPFIPQLKELGIRNINLSLDTLQSDKFWQITHRDQFAAVINTLESLLEHDMRVKLNVVVMDGINTDELISFAAMTAQQPVSVRFIEEMPFNGQGHAFSGIQWHYKKILDTLETAYPLEKIQDAPHATALNYRIPGHIGTIGVIPAYSRTFCGSCNRIRITPTGGLKTCLYGHDVLNVRDLLRSGANSELLLHEIQQALNKRAANGIEAEKERTQWSSMSTIGG